MNTMNTKVLVTYGTKHGATAEIAQCIAEVLASRQLNVIVSPVDQIQIDDVARYQAVVLGSAVYAGAWQKEAAHFLTVNETILAARRVWLFSSGPTGEADPATLMHGWRFPEALQATADRIKPHDIAFFHGKIDTAQLRFPEKLIIKAMNVQTGDFREWDAIRSWADKIAIVLMAMADENQAIPELGIEMQGNSPSS